MFCYRDTGNVEQARRVNIDQVPTVQILTGGAHYTDSASPPHAKHKSPLVIKENAIAGRLTSFHTVLIENQTRY